MTSLGDKNIDNLMSDATSSMNRDLISILDKIGRMPVSDFNRDKPIIKVGKSNEYCTETLKKYSSSLERANSRLKRTKSFNNQYMRIYSRRLIRAQFY